MLTLITNIEVGPLTEKATTVRDNFPFNSFFELDGVYYCTSPDGLFELGGDTDDGADIDAYVEPVSTNFGIDDQKRLPYMYTRLEADGEVEVKVGVDKGILYGPFAIAEAGMSSGMKERRTKLPEGLKGNYWRARISNVDGSFFSLKNVGVVPTVIKRGGKTF